MTSASQDCLYEQSLKCLYHLATDLLLQLRRQSQNQEVPQLKFKQETRLAENLGGLMWLERGLLGIYPAENKSKLFSGEIREMHGCHTHQGYLHIEGSR
jgi:hypothetical protein